ncbi:twin-arginine translocase subunit TatC [Haloferacaceae archaeon DSL9]
MADNSDSPERDDDVESATSETPPTVDDDPSRPVDGTDEQSPESETTDTDDSAGIDHEWEESGFFAVEPSTDGGAEAESVPPESESDEEADEDDESVDDLGGAADGEALDDGEPELTPVDEGAFEDADADDSDLAAGDPDDPDDDDDPALVADDADDDDLDDGIFGNGPDTDQEMPLADHIEEMMRRLGIVFLFAGVATVVAYPYADQAINYLWGTHIPAPDVNRPRIYAPLEYILTKLKVAGLSGLLVGLPVFVYQTYRFMRPGLYRSERRYYLAAVPTSLVLGVVGMLFAHFLVLPFIFSYFTTYTADAATIAFGLQETFNLILVLLGFMAVIFQIPLFIMLAIMMGIVTRRWLEDKRLIFWGLFLGIAFIASPDPTGMAPIIVTMTMIVLYEGTLVLLRWTGN